MSFIYLGRPSGNRRLSLYKKMPPGNPDGTIMATNIFYAIRTKRFSCVASGYFSLSTSERNILSGRA